MGDTFQRLRIAAIRSEGALTLHVKYRDHGAESAYESRYSKAPDGPIYSMMERTLHRLEGGAFFQHQNLEVLFDLAVQDLEAAVAAGLDTQSFSQTKLQQRRAKVGEGHERLERVASAVRGMQNFYGNQNLLRVAEWLEHLDGEASGRRYEVKGNSLTDHVKASKVEMPATYRMVEMDLLRGLHKMI